MSKTILITSFSTWKSSQPINAADQLLGDVLGIYPPSPSVYFLRQLPVNTAVARDITIAQIHQLNPQVLLCCGMAETRARLNLETRAVVGNRTLHTAMAVSDLLNGLTYTEVSHDAGRFVCNSFYHSLLDYLQDAPCVCLFIHVPILTTDNRSQILIDFCKILDRCMV
jgi:pyroglutamyl-peptidase